MRGWLSIYWFLATEVMNGKGEESELHRQVGLVPEPSLPNARIIFHSVLGHEGKCRKLKQLGIVSLASTFPFLGAPF